MPADDGLWLHDDQHITPVWQEPREQYPKQPIRWPQRWSRRYPLHRGELVPKSKEFQLEHGAASESIEEH